MTILLYMTFKFVCLALLSTNLNLDFAARGDLDDENLGEEVDLVFWRFGFFGILGSSVRGMSFNISDASCRSMDSKSRESEKNEMCK